MVPLMESGVDEVAVSCPFGDFVVQVRRFGASPQPAQAELTRWAAGQFRSGIELAEPAMVRAARQLLQLLDGNGFAASPAGDELGFGARAGVSGAADTLDSAFGGIAARLEQELLSGRLVVKREQLASLTDRAFELPELPPLPPAQRESGTHTFEVRFVDEIGKAISGIDVEFTADGAKTRPTNAAGVALLQDVTSARADVAILDPEALAQVLDPRWEDFRPGSP